MSSIPHFDRANYERGRSKEIPLMDRFCSVYQVFTYSERPEFDVLDFNLQTTDGSNYYYRAEVKTSTHTSGMFSNVPYYKLTAKKHLAARKFKENGILTFLIIGCSDGEIYWLNDLAAVSGSYAQWRYRDGSLVSNGAEFINIPTRFFTRVPHGACLPFLPPSGVLETRIAR